MRKLKTLLNLAGRNAGSGGWAQVCSCMVALCALWLMRGYDVDAATGRDSEDKVVKGTAHG